VAQWFQELRLPDYMTTAQDGGKVKYDIYTSSIPLHAIHKRDYFIIFMLYYVCIGRSPDEAVLPAKAS